MSRSLSDSSNQVFYSVRSKRRISCGFATMPR